MKFKNLLLKTRIKHSISDNVNIPLHEAKSIDADIDKLISYTSELEKQVNSLQRKPMFKFIRYRKENKHKEVIHDVGWSLWIGKLHIKHNKQDAYNGIHVEWWKKYPSWVYKDNKK